MKKKIYYINHNASSTSISKETFKSLGDWLNYFEGCWIICSYLTKEQIYEKIKVENSSSFILIVEINIKNYYGWMPQDAWDWLDDKIRQQNSF